MRLPICLLIALPFSLPGQTSGTCASPFEAPAAAAREIAMNLRAGDVTIVGTEAAVVRVSCTIGGSGSGDVKITFAANRLTVRGGPRNEVRFRIEVPRTTNLVVRCPAGDFMLSGITGDKDIELNAGDLTIEVGDPSAYRHVEASVLAGDLRASAFGVDKDGLFRSFDKSYPSGRYRLRARLLAGDLTLK
jgi:hypothetical protein